MVKHKLEKEKRSGLILFITGLIILLSTIVWAIVWSLDLGIYVLAMGYPVIYFGVLGLFVFFVGIYILLKIELRIFKSFFWLFMGFCLDFFFKYVYFKIPNAEY